MLRPEDDAFLRDIQASVARWNALLERVASTTRSSRARAARTHAASVESVISAR